jgi:hypothetical protein
MWQPISEVAIWDKLNAGVDRMGTRQKKLWEAIQIMPEKWSQPLHGKVGGGFWAVGIIGPTVLWFNDIEDGFNHSSYSRYGIIDQYSCNQSELEEAVQRLLDIIDTGYDSGPFSGPPLPGIYPGGSRNL